MKQVQSRDGARGGRRPQRPQRRSELTLAILCAFGGSASANPTGPSVVSGQASIVSSGRTLSITNTPGAIIN